MNRKILVFICIGLSFFSINLEGKHEERSNYLELISVENFSKTKPFDLNNDVELFEGYVLFTPEFSRNTFIINHEGNIVHTWVSKNPQGIPAYLLDNGTLLRGCSPGLGVLSRFTAGGFTGSLEMYDWDGNQIWQYLMANDTLCLHNDIEPLPTGNILSNAWEYKTAAEAIEIGWNASMLKNVRGFLIDCILEIEPIFPEGGNIVWEWHLWDHLIQDYDSSKENYGIVKDHPELIDINAKGRYALERHRSSLFNVDFSHMNSIDYNEKLDQILVSLALLSEVIIIDHSTTSSEAEKHSGGRYGKGGDLLYRWGNPQNYHRGDENDKILFSQHDARLIEDGCPGEGNIIVFNNGMFRPNGNYSSVDEFTPPLDENGCYQLSVNESYGPIDFAWSYTADPKTSFYSIILSGAHRLASGNTLICNGRESHFFVITSDKEIIWEYFNWRPLPFFHLNQVFKFEYYPTDYSGILLSN